MISNEEFFHLAQSYAHLPGTCLLYSGGDFDSAQNSYLFLFPTETISITDHQAPWETLKTAVGPLDGGDPFPGWVGYLSYEMGAHHDPDKKIPYKNPDIPLAFFQKHALTLIYDGKGIIARPNRSQNLIIEKSGELQAVYCNKVEEAKELIRAGEIYQVNLSQQFLLSGEHDPFEIFTKLAEINPAPFSAYLNCGDFCIISSSPERFLQKKHNTLETRPIKGTAPRGKTPEEDEKNKHNLLNSEKEKAELLMITDLMRNDLGRVSCLGSVNTKKIWSLEAYTNVFHMLSIIESTPKPHLHPVDIVRPCFPGGSITGCPKLRAMEVIADLEQRPRGIYTGSIGYFTNTGDFDFNIAIRTILSKGTTLDVQLGGAIVADSIPEKEYEETLHKGASIFESLGADFMTIN